MGYIVSSITDPSITPEILGRYCIYLIREDCIDGVAKDLSTNFREYGTRLSNRAAIFAASDYETYNESFVKIFQGDSWFEITLGQFYNIPPGLIITKPGLPQFRAERGDVFIYVSAKVINLVYHNPHELSQELIDLCRHDEDRFITKILKYSRGTIVKPGPHTKALLEKIPEAIIFEPNINGIGIKPKSFVDLIRERANPEVKSPQYEHREYDCVVYQY